MENILASRVRDLRKSKGFSQEELAEKSGLNLRTVQRIEKGENEPRGDSLVRLAQALQISSEELFNFSKTEDRSALMGLNLSGLAFLLFPILGIIIPLILWYSRREKVTDAYVIGAKVLNFQLTCMLIYSIAYVGSILWLAKDIASPEVMPSLMASLKFALAFSFTIKVFNAAFILINSRKIQKEKPIRYFPAIRFIKEKNI